MKGDFTRNTFNPDKHFSRVLMQQGRVTLDADFNEQASILLHQLRTMARDLIGPHAAPAEHPGFRLSQSEQGGLAISAGRYYVDGILVENDRACTYLDQPYGQPGPDDRLRQSFEGKNASTYWLYLDVWEEHITALEDDSIREPALGGLDTCTRAAVVWQVKALELDGEKEGPKHGMTCDAPLSRLLPFSHAGLAARVDPGHPKEDVCITPPSARYRGTENQLYRVEIHRGGKDRQPTFKWSRNNGSTAARWLGTDGHNLLVDHARGFAAGCAVEAGGALVQLSHVEAGILSVDSADTPPVWSKSMTNPIVRRWDQSPSDDLQLDEGAVPLREEEWIDLEDGVQVRFAAGGTYRAGDYWLIPARVGASDLDWPSDETDASRPAYLSPHGVEHHYAPLGFAVWSKEKLQISSCECEFLPLSDCYHGGSTALGAELLRTGDRIDWAKAPATAAPAPEPAAPAKKIVTGSKKGT